MPSKNQTVRLRQRATQAEELARERSEELTRQKEEIAGLRQQLKSSSSSTTPPGKGTQAQRTSASRPRWETRSSQQEAILEQDEEEEREEQKGESPDGDLDEGRDEEESDDDSAADNGGEDSDDDHDMHIMRQLLEDFREKRLSPSEREALMRAAGGQFTQLLTQHWKEKSNPPRWLVSLFRPASAPASAAQVNQVNTPPTARSSTTEQNDNNGGSSSPGLIFRRPDLPAETQSSPVRPRNLATEFASTPRNDSTHRPSNPVAPSTPPLANFPMPDGTPSTYLSGTTKFQFRQSDIPTEIAFSGKPGEPDVVEVLTRYKARVKLASVAQDNPPDHVVDQRAIQFLPFVLRDAAYDSLVQLVDGTLEWRSENRLTALRNAGQCVKPRAPATWEEYCHAFTFLFSAPNRISVLAREIATIKQSEDQTVDTYSLKVTQARTRLLAEAARSAPSHLSPHEHAWDVFMTATFENGLLPSIRLESIREDPPNTFQEARIRAKKHEANNLRGVSSTAPSTVSAVAYPKTPQLQNSVSSNTAIIKDLKEEIAKLKSAVKQPGNRAANQGSSAKRARTSDKSTTASATEQKGEKCTYPGCKFRHSIDKCALRQKHESQGWTRQPV